MPKFLIPTSELLSPQSVRRAEDVIYLAGKSAQSKGGQKKAEKIAARNQKIRDKATGGALVKTLAKEEKLSPFTIRKILRMK